MAFDYDLFVIGGGSGGVRAARLAASEANAKVALAEESRLGGTCVIRGCVPKKLMVFASQFNKVAADARAYGWDMTDGTFDWLTFRGHLHAELARLETVYGTLLANAGVTTYAARATLKDAHTVTLSTGQEITAKHILVATGGRPVRPDIENADLGMISDDLFDLAQLPKRLLIVGGGYIACEFACILHGLGVDVTQYYRGEQILRGFDDEARTLVAEAMQARGINLKLATNIQEMSGTQGAIQIVSTKGEQVEFDAVLFATGRKPNTDCLGLEALGLALGRNGQVLVDDYSQTTMPSIFAVGDVTNRVNLTPVAIREAAAFVQTVFHGKPEAVDHDLIPSAVFTQPEMGTVGLSEEAARAQEPVDIYATSFRPMKTAFAGRPDKVLMKLVVSQASQKVLGCHIVAPDAGEMIQLAGVAIKMGATKADFDRTVAVHPTMAEELVTLKNPVRNG